MWSIHPVPPKWIPPSSFVCVQQRTQTPVVRENQGVLQLRSFKLSWFRDPRDPTPVEVLWCRDGAGDPRDPPQQAHYREEIERAMYEKASEELDLDKVAPRLSSKP